MEVPGTASGSEARIPPWTPGVVLPSRELRLLIRALRAWIEGRVVETSGDGSSGSLGLITGAAGSGKSILLDALAAALRGWGVRCAHTSCFRDGLCGESALHLIEQALSLLFAGAADRVGTGSEAWGSIQGLLPQLRRWLPDSPWPPAEASSETSARSPALSGSFGAELDRLHSVDVVGRTFVALAQGEPLVLLVDDVQRMDALSREMLAAALRIAGSRGGTGSGEPSRGQAKLLVVAGLDTGQPPGLDGLREVGTLAFEVEARGYSREEIRELAISLGVDIPLSQRETLLRITNGSPCLVRFFLRACTEDGEPALARVPEEPERGAQAGARLFKARLAALPQDAHRLVALLSAAERPWPTSWLLAALHAGEKSPGPSGEAEVGGLLARLVVAGWVERVPCAGEPRWRICGEPIAERVRNGLAKAERREVDSALADGILLHEVDRAPPGGSAVRPGVWTLVNHYLLSSPDHPRRTEAGLAAAQEAEQRSSIVRAIEILEHILDARDLEKDGSSQDEVRAMLAEFLDQAGHHRESVELLSEIFSRRFDRMNPEDRARAARRIGTIYGKLGEARLQAAQYQAGLSYLDGTGESTERLILLAHMARVSLESGQGDEGLRYLEKSMRFPGSGGLDENADYVEIYRLAQEVSLRRGEYVEAIGFEKSLLDHYEATGDRAGILRSAENLAHLYLLRGELAEGERFLYLALEGARSSGPRLLVARCLAQLGRFHRSRGESAKSRDFLIQARDLFHELGREEAASDLHLGLFHVHLLLRDFDAAAESLVEYAHRSGGFGTADANPGIFPAIYPDLRTRSEIIDRLLVKGSPRDGGSHTPRKDVPWDPVGAHLVDAGRYAEASRLYEQALRSRDSLHNPLTLARLLQHAGRLHRLLGNRRVALRYLEKSLECLGPVPQKALVGNAYIEVASIFEVQGEVGKAFDFLLRGWRLFQEVDEDQGLLITTLRLGNFLRGVGLPKPARRIAEAAVDLSRHSRAKRWEADAYRLLGGLHSEAGDYQESARCLSRSRSLVEVLGLPYEHELLLLEAGWEYCRRENHSAALRVAREGLDAARALGAQDLLDDFLFLLGVVESSPTNKGKNFLRALEALHQALIGAQERIRPAVEARILDAIAAIYAERGNNEVAADFSERARCITEGLAARWISIRTTGPSVATTLVGP